MGWKERKQTIAALEAARGSRVICFLTSDREGADSLIQKDVLPLLFRRLTTMCEAGPPARIDLLVHTAGGDTLAGFGIGQLIREFAPKVGVLVPFRCHSAGTLLALGADEIVMTKGATLSPIDPSIVGALNPAVEVAPGQRQMVPLSVETVAGFKDLVTKDWEMKGEEALTAAFRLLGEKVHPLALGDVYRARQQIEDLARKLLQAHRKDDDAIPKIVKELTRGLGSHDYPISRSHARTLLGAQVAADSTQVEKLIWSLFEDYSEEMELRQRFDIQVILNAHRLAGTPGQAKAKQILAVLEDTDSSDVAERELELLEIPGPTGPIPAGRIVKAGWRRQIDEGG